MVNNAGVQILGNNGRLLDDGNLQPGNGIYFLNPGDKDGIVVIGHQGRVPHDNARFFFRVNGVGAAATYVEMNLLENQAVRNKLRNLNIHIQSQKINNLQLCVKLHIESWCKNIAEFRESKAITDKRKIIAGAFADLTKSVKRIDNKFTSFIKKVQLEMFTPNIHINNDGIVDRYMTLRICFHETRAHGDATRALKYLLRLVRIDNSFEEEDNVIDNGFVDCFTHHIAKHFCHHSVMTNPGNAFRAVGIDQPQNNKPYTSLSYDELPATIPQALTNAQNVYKDAIRNLLKDYDLMFDIENGTKITIRLKEKVNIKEHRKLKTIGTLQNMAFYNNINAAKLIFKNTTHIPEILPKIWYIENYNDAAQIPVATKLKNGELCVFFNLGMNFTANNPLFRDGISGSLFPVVN